MSVSVVIKDEATATEVLEGNTDSALASKRTVTHDLFNETVTLSAGTTPPVTKCAHFVQALSGGAATIDLTALTGANAASVDGTGLKVQLFRIKNLGANVMSITFGAANPYELAGADFKMTLQPGQRNTFFGNDATPDIAGGAKNIDLAGTGSQTCEITIDMG